MHDPGERITVLPGDCREVLATLADNSIDAVVTDPPYSLVSIAKRFGKPGSAPCQYGADGRYARASAGFMGQQWDTGETAFDPVFWAQVLRVMKPGGHLLACGGTRTYHRLVCAIEDAGFEIRDSVSYLHASGPLLWVFGSGFPKSLNISSRLNDFRCMCGLSKTASLSSSIIERTVLRPQMCGDREADASKGENLRRMSPAMDSARPFSGSERQNLFAGMQCVPDIASQEGQDESTANALRNLRKDDLQGSNESTSEQECILQLLMPKQDVCGTAAPIRGQRSRQDAAGNWAQRSSESSVEGRRDVSPSARQLRERSLREMPTAFDFDGKSGRLCDGASPGDGADGQAAIIADGMRASSRSSAIEQCADQSGTMAMQSQSQERGAWPHCGRCGKPIVPDGLGTALKPAMELICLARKPLSEGTIAANVLKWGTGALNIDGCRVESDEVITNHARSGKAEVLFGANKQQETHQSNGQHIGRWPANVIHDGSDEVVAAFPDVHGAGSAQGKQEKWADQEKKEGWGNIGLGANGARFGDSGSAARFFASFNGRDGEASAKRLWYGSKADGDDRLGSSHPTIKPLDLIQYLCRLICPPGGTILDCFAGTGTTGEAAFREGMRAVLIEREPQYVADIERRIKLMRSGPMERLHESLKCRGNVSDDIGPLFSGILERD